MERDVNELIRINNEKLQSMLDKDYTVDDIYNKFRLDIAYHSQYHQVLSCYLHY